MNRKAQFEVARKTIYWMIAGFLIVVIIFAFALMIATYKNRLTYVPPQLKADFIALRFTNIPECFAYQDLITKRVYPGVIDINKFDETRLFKCYHTDPVTGNQDYNFKLELKNKAKIIVTNKFANKVDFTFVKKVLVKDGDTISIDDLQIYVQTTIRKGIAGSSGGSS